MSESDSFNLQRFVDAQANGVYEQALAEIGAGEKRSHWMWFIFPQHRDLGRSATAKYYGLSGEDEARAFNTHVFQQTGRWPGLYAGHYLKELLGTHSDTVLANSWLWIAQYGPTAVVPPNWPTWTMWQYTDGAIGPQPHSVAGIGRCDRDRFNGSEAQLRRLWGVAP
jgi:hypothetical protein